MRDLWTDEIIDRLKTLHAEGLSFSGMAATINAEFRTTFSRNALIGKALRAGLTAANPRGKGGNMKPKSIAPRETPRRTPFRPPGRVMSEVRPTYAFKPKPIEAEPAIEPIEADVVEILEPLKTLFDLAADDCRMILADRDMLGVVFCGRPARPGASYCATHCRRVFAAGR